MTKYFIGAIIVLGLIIGGGWWLVNNSTTTPTPADQTATTTESSFNTSTTSPNGGPGSYSIEEVAKHNLPEDCWTTIGGGVYDLTKWISQHPGGEEAIIGLCGIDGTAAFTAQHGGAEKQADVLTTFKIGDLAK